MALELGLEVPGVQGHRHDALLSVSAIQLVAEHDVSL
jgi:hypothetical protein